MKPILIRASLSFWHGTRALATLGAFALGAFPLRAQLFTNLQAFPDRIAVGDPQIRPNDNAEGPKGIASADFNGDGKPDLAVGNLDGTITVLMGLGSGRFSAQRHVRTGALELRSVLAADLNADGKPDLAAASPMDGKLLVYFNPGDGTFDASTPLAGWVGVRCLAAGDFDGDGVMDLAAAGPGHGVRHFRGTGGGTFTIMGDLPRLSPLYAEVPRPVYTMRTIRSRDGLRDDLLVTHADSPALWILSTVPTDRTTEPPMDLTTLPAWGTLPSPVLLHEVQVQNARTLRDADGTYQPWVELVNKSDAVVNLAGWSLGSDNDRWSLPSVELAPGRMLVVFLSGQNRNLPPELHASFVLKQNSQSLSLLQPDGSTAHSIGLPEHTATDVSYGLAPDRDALKYFDIPSPGAENNAGLNLDDINADTVGASAPTLIIEPRNPAPNQSVRVTVTMAERPTGSSWLRHVWFSTMPGLQEVHHVMRRKSPGVYQEVLPPGAFTANMPHRVLARLRDGVSNDYTAEVHRGLDEAQFSGLAAPQPGRLLPVASVPSPKAKAFETGPLTTKTDVPGAAPDLVLADEVGGLLVVHRASPGARRFAPMPSQSVAVRGAPRDVKLADTNGDGWLDATVVLRSLDLALNLKNENGSLRAVGEFPTGRSPREAVMADFTGDGKPDAAVINRYSADVSILPSSATASGFVGMDQIYPVDGEVAGLDVRDCNGDGRDDVVQLHRASGEISIRYAAPDGSLGPPEFQRLATQAPSGMALADVNNDGLVDMVTANLGGNSVSVLLALAEGGFAPPSITAGEGGMFAISVADFDGDGNQDLATGLFDCRVSILRGDGTGRFTNPYAMQFVYEARVMVTGDFDQDGDIDIAGGGYAGDLVTLENRGATSVAGWKHRTYARPSTDVSGTYRTGLTDVDRDGDPDVVLGTGRGVAVYRGTAGMGFEYAPELSLNVGFPVSDVLTSDLDGDGTLEMVAACREASCINILKQNAAGTFSPAVQADVPSGRFLASGDLDGDGKPDLVGSGDVLWTALSSRPPLPATTAPDGPGRSRLSEVVINEVLSQNTDVPVADDDGRKTDFLEIYNGSAGPVTWTGWKLRLQSTQEGVVVDRTWTLPSGRADSKGHAVVLFSEQTAPMHTGFTLPAEGGTVTLIKPDGSESDSVTYPPALENVSWSRYLDGHPTFRADRIPSPGMSNLDNGTVPPEVKLTPPSRASLVAGRRIKFTARGRDDAGILSLSLLWNRLDAPMPQPQRVVLYDDGMHADGASLDGFFAGELAPGLPAGAEVQFYLEAVDLSGEVLLLPDNAELTVPGTSPVAWSFSLTPPPALEIAEVSSNNVSLLRDDMGENPDYVKVRNTGSTPVDMSRILLAKSPLAAVSSVFSFPAGLTLSPGAELTVYADNNPESGPLHAPFTLDAEGDDLALLALTPSGARQWVHSLTVPAFPVEASYRRLPGTDLRAVLPANADLTNWSGTSWDGDGLAFATLHFTALAGVTYRIEGTEPGDGAPWALLEAIPGDGAVHTIVRPTAEISQLRLVSTVPTPRLRVDAVLPASTQARAQAWIFGETAGLTRLVCYYGPNDAGTNRAAWANVSGDLVHDFPPGTPPPFELGSLGVVPADFSLAPNSVYFYRLYAESATGVLWSAPGTSFRTPALTGGSIEHLTLRRLSAGEAHFEIKVRPGAPAGTTVMLLGGTVDALGNEAAWQLRVPAARAADQETWTAALTGLAPETGYFVRALITTPQGSLVSPQRLDFRAPGLQGNLALNLRLSEIMYHPAPPSEAEAAAGFEEDDFEYIELHNASNESMDLSGLWFSSGLNFDFPLSGAPVVPPDGRAVIAAHPHAFAMRYGNDIPLAGWTLHPFRNARLANGGEFIALRAADGTVLFNVFYNDSPDSTDGWGFSLEYRPASDPLLPEDWQRDYRASRLTGGTPGQAPVPTPDLNYNSWLALEFTPAQLGQPGTIGASADPDRDGLTNFAEFVCGTRPLVPDSKDVLHITRHENGQGTPAVALTFPVNPRAVGVQTSIEVQSPLSTFGGSPNVLATYANDSGDLTYGANNLWWIGVRMASATLSADETQVLVTFVVTGWAPPAVSDTFFRLKMTKP